MFDADTDTNPAKEDWIKLHKKENGQILKSLNYEDSDWPTEHLVKSNLTMWKTNLTKELELEFGDSYKPHLDKACAHYGHAKSLNKNPLVIAKALELAWIAGVKSVLLQNLVNSIINFAKIQFPNNTHIETSAVDDNTAAYGYVSH
jgi:hypothetical protein